MGAGVITVFVKNDTGTAPISAPAPNVTSTTPPANVPTVAPTTNVESSKQLAARQGSRKTEDEVAKIPKLPASGVSDHPIGIAFVALGGALAIWVRRAART